MTLCEQTINADFKKTTRSGRKEAGNAETKSRQAAEKSVLIFAQRSNQGSK